LQTCNEYPPAQVCQTFRYIFSENYFRAPHRETMRIESPQSLANKGFTEHCTDAMQEQQRTAWRNREM